MRLSWEDDAWEDYLYWQRQDKKVLKRVNASLTGKFQGGILGADCSTHETTGPGSGRNADSVILGQCWPLGGPQGPLCASWYPFCDQGRELLRGP